MECLIRRLLFCYNHVMLEKITILKETEDYAVVYKPAGLAVETGDTFQQDLEELVSRQIQVRQVKAVNRLDLPVEGIVLLSKNKKAAAILSQQIRDRETRKIYYAVVTGCPEQKTGRLRNFLKKDPVTNSSGVVTEGSPGAKEAILDYRVLATREETAADGSRQTVSLLKIHLLTGRHHQIRVQLSAAGMPIVNDAKYGTGSRGKTQTGSCGKAQTGSRGKAQTEKSASLQTPEESPRGRRFLRRGSHSSKVFPALCAAEFDFRDPRNGEPVQIRVKPQNEKFQIFGDLLKIETCSEVQV